MKRVIAVLMCISLLIMTLPVIVFASNTETAVSLIALECSAISTGDNPSKITYTSYPSNAVTGTAIWEKNDGNGWVIMDSSDVFTDGYSYKINASNLVAKEGYTITSDTEFQLNDYFRPSEKNCEFVLKKFKIEVKNGKAINKKGEEVSAAWASEEITIEPNSIPTGKAFYEWDITMEEKGYGAHRYINKNTGSALLTMPGTNTIMEAKYKYPLSRVDVIFKEPVVGEIPSNVTYKTTPYTGKYESFTWEKRKNAIDFYSDSYFDESEYEQIKNEGFLEGYCYRVSLDREAFGDYMVTDETEILFNGLTGSAPESLTGFEETFEDIIRLSYAWDALKKDADKYPERVDKINVFYDKIVIGEHPKAISYNTVPESSVTGEILWEEKIENGWKTMSETDIFKADKLYRINAGNLKAIDGYQINRLTEYHFNNKKRNDIYNPVFEQHSVVVDSGTIYDTDNLQIKSAFPGDEIWCKAKSISGKTFWGWKFNDEGVVYRLGADKNIIIITMPDFDLEINANYKTPIDKIEANCSSPQLGSKPSKIEYTSQPKDTFVGDNQWWKSLDGKHFTSVESNEVFEKGYYYAVSFEGATYIDQNYYVSDDTKFFVNGKILVETELYIWNPLKDIVIVSSGGYVPIIQKIKIISYDGILTLTNTNGDTINISVQDGYELVDVIVNGESKGVVFRLTGLKTGDSVKIISNKTNLEKEQLIESVTLTDLFAKSKIVTLRKGKRGIKILWKSSDSMNLDLDGYEVFRSAKRYSGFGKKPIFTTEKNQYYNTAVKKGNTYYYKVRGYKIINGEKVYTKWSNKAWRKI